MNSEKFKALILSYMQIRHVKHLQDLRQHTSLSPATFCKYWKEPSKFPIGDVIRIFDYLKIPYEERGQVLNRE